jgi:hypothetical protein
MQLLTNPAVIDNAKRFVSSSPRLSVEPTQADSSTSNYPSNGVIQSHEDDNVESDKGDTQSAVF